MNIMEREENTKSFLLYIDDEDKYLIEHQGKVGILKDNCLCFDCLSSHPDHDSMCKRILRDNMIKLIKDSNARKLIDANKAQQQNDAKRLEEVSIRLYPISLTILTLLNGSKNTELLDCVLRKIRSRIISMLEMSEIDTAELVDIFYSLLSNGNDNSPK